MAGNQSLYPPQNPQTPKLVPISDNERNAGFLFAFAFAFAVCFASPWLSCGLIFSIGEMMMMMMIRIIMMTMTMTMTMMATIV